jgi:hypothetical protein
MADAFPTEQYYVYNGRSTGGTIWTNVTAALGGFAPTQMFTSLGPYGPGSEVHVSGNCKKLQDECRWRAAYIGLAALGAAPTCYCNDSTAYTCGFASSVMLPLAPGWTLYSAGLAATDDDDGSIMDWSFSTYRMHRPDARPYEEGGCIVRQKGGGADCSAGTADLYVVPSDGPQPRNIEHCALCFPSVA